MSCVARKPALFRVALRLSHYYDLRAGDAAYDTAQLSHAEEALLYGGSRGFGPRKIVEEAGVGHNCCRCFSNEVAYCLLTDIEVLITCHCDLKTASCIIAKSEQRSTVNTVLVRQR